MEETIINNETTLKEEVVKKSERNTTLNLFEFIAACLIVFIHIHFPEPFGKLVDGLARFGVPLFFTVAGFYMIKPGMDKEDLRNKLKLRIFKVLKLLIFSFVIYFILGLIISIFGSHAQGVVEYLKSTFNIKTFVKFLIINTAFVQGVNWFMIAMIFSYIIIYIFANQFLNNKLLIKILSGMLIFWIVIRTVFCLTNATLFGFSLYSGVWYKTWWSSGLLFISFGMLLKQYEKEIYKISTKLILILMVISFISQPLEYYLLEKYFNIFTTYYIGNILCVFTIISLSIKNPNILSNSKFINQKGNYTMFIYIFHPAIITIINFVIKKLGLESNELVSWIAPIIVLILAVASAMIFNKILCIIKDKRKLKKSESI